ncbi:hypothetical protein [Vibrio sp. THAF190c]|uniref:hypothetical protein n=1 Tax=Vibrio sp. THAF190c TaxID=2587865 RepID=UPI001268135D|nr:hypothetical protein [Vibrio sp. THAF190c]QFT12013.1 hypothetical protein FIV04_18970 [Vibrio sp. THAF190c]
MQIVAKEKSCAVLAGGGKRANAALSDDEFKRIEYCCIFPQIEVTQKLNFEQNQIIIAKKNERAKNNKSQFDVMNDEQRKNY